MRADLQKGIYFLGDKGVGLKTVQIKEVSLIIQTEI